MNMLSQQECNFKQIQLVPRDLVATDELIGFFALAQDLIGKTYPESYRGTPALMLVISVTRCLDMMQVILCAAGLMLACDQHSILQANQ